MNSALPVCHGARITGLNPCHFRDRLFHAIDGARTLLILPYPMRSMNCLLAAAFAVLSTSCQLEPSASERTVAPSFNPPAGKALICVYRPSKPFTGLARRPVFINNQHVASTSLGSFVAIPVEPGTYNVEAGAGALWDTPAAHIVYPDIILKLRPGQTVFIRQFIDPTKRRVIPGPRLPNFGAKVVDASTGRAECSSLKQVGALPLEATVTE